MLLLFSKGQTSTVTYNLKANVESKSRYKKWQKCTRSNWWL